MEKNHIVLKLISFGIKAKKTEVSIVKVAIECPEGRLVFPRTGLQYGEVAHGGGPT